MSAYDDETEPVHRWFNLTYANYLVLPRTFLQSMPVEWQRRFCTELDELYAAFRHVEQADQYRVMAVDDRGKFMNDPVPHYNRGRTRIAPEPPAPVSKEDAE